MTMLAQNSHMATDKLKKMGSLWGIRWRGSSNDRLTDVGAPTLDAELVMFDGHEHTSAAHPPVSVGSLTSSPADKYFLQGLEAHKAGNLDLALAKYKQALSIDEGHVDTLNSIAFLYCQRGDLDGGGRMYSRALEMHPDHVETVFNMAAFHHVYKNNSTEAAALYNRVLTMNPMHINSLFNIAELRFQAGKYTECLTAYQRILMMDPNNENARVNMNFLLEDKAFTLYEYPKTARGGPTEEIHIWASPTKQGNEIMTSTVMAPPTDPLWSQPLPSYTPSTASSNAPSPNQSCRASHTVPLMQTPSPDDSPPSHSPTPANQCMGDSSAAPTASCAPSMHSIPLQAVPLSDSSPLSQTTLSREATPLSREATPLSQYAQYTQLPTLTHFDNSRKSSSASASVTSSQDHIISRDSSTDSSTGSRSGPIRGDVALLGALNDSDSRSIDSSVEEGADFFDGIATWKKSGTDWVNQASGKRQRKKPQPVVGMC